MQTKAFNKILQPFLVNNTKEKKSQKTRNIGIEEKHLNLTKNAYGKKKECLWKDYLPYLLRVHLLWSGWVAEGRGFQKHIISNQLQAV